MAIELCTPRLTLRLALPEEAELVVDYVTRNKAHLAPWEPSREPFYFTPEHWRGELQKFKAEARDERSLRLHLFEGSRLVGAANLNNVVRGSFQSAHLGFSLDHERQGHGLMKEALEAVIAHAFSPDGVHLHRIEANYQPHNLRSAALLKRLGFREQGFAREYLLLDGAWRDHVMTALIHEAWTESR